MRKLSIEAMRPRPISLDGKELRLIRAGHRKFNLSPDECLAIKAKNENLDRTLYGPTCKCDDADMWYALNAALVDILSSSSAGRGTSAPPPQVAPVLTEAEPSERMADSLVRIVKKAKKKVVKKKAGR